eukprot:270363-Ditylum_brightwellii.AAC.1
MSDEHDVHKERVSEAENCEYQEGRALGALQHLMSFCAITNCSTSHDCNMSSYQTSTLDVHCMSGINIYCKLV